MEKLKFGILVSLGILNTYKDDLNHFQKITNNQLLYELKNIQYEDLESSIDYFKKEYYNDIISKESEVERFKSEFFLVCYIVEKKSIKEMKKIKELF